MENLKVRIVTIDEMFEKNPWITTIRELFPFETIEIAYKLDELEGAILIEAISPTYGKVFSRTIKFAPENK